jgi:integrase/recombinase XerD
MMYPRCHLRRRSLKALIAACDKYFDKANAVRLRALTLVLRYSGLRISDAVTLMKDKIKDDILTLRTAKTGTAVRIPLPPSVLQALKEIKTGNEYYFWSGHGTPKSCASSYQRAFKRLYEIAEVENGHAHRWRDTFAVELLLSGMSLEQVSILLGHQSVRVTERHYSPWVKVRHVKITYGQFNASILEPQY